MFYGSAKETKLYQYGEEYFVKRQAGKDFRNIEYLTGRLYRAEKQINFFLPTGCPYRT
jgi:hypothetical protein